MKISSQHPLVGEMTAWRRHLHQYPETAFEEVLTSDFLTARLKEFGMDRIHQGIAKTGVVASLSNGEGPSIALRADMDALDMVERTNVPHCSQHDGKMHGCGHDGHMAMLLGAAKYLSENRTFKGTVHFIFQPAEENEGGAEVMLREGLFDQFPAQAVFGLHNWPEMSAGQMAMSAGPIMAACDAIDIRIKGKGCHGAMPHLGLDPVVVASEIVLALQTISSRVINPQDACVVTIAHIEGGHTWNVIPDEVRLRGTVRSFKPEVRVREEECIKRIVKGICEAHGADFELNYIKGYPATINDADQTDICARAAAKVVGAENLDLNPVPSMGAEDFAFMLEAKPGCYVWLGTGGMPGGCLLHNPGYDFNDDVLHLGASYWVALVEELLG